MKQLTLNDELKARVKSAAPDVDPEKVAIFEAAALSTAPVRKKHPVYMGAVHTTNFLAQMLGELTKESRPLQIMHGSSDGDQLPIGRVFAGNISEGTGIDGATELLTLFWIDNTHSDLIAKVNSGTIDQVSVAILGKSAKSNKTGFDFMGPKADIENIWGGVDDKGNRMGHDGAHVIVDELDSWFEMSLVGQGGAQGARIKGNRLQLSASGQEVPQLTLELSTGSAAPTPIKTDPQKDLFDMDAKDFAGIIAENATKLANAEAAAKTEKERADALQTQLTAAQSELTELKGSDQAAKLTAAEAKATDLQTKLDAALALPGKLVAPLFTMLGQTSATLDADPDKAVTQVREALDGVKAIGARLSGGLAQLGSAPARSNSNAGFKRRAS
ncbi:MULTISPECIES: hypothetical protein [Methylobacterium]|uniref:Uncharacterized protein n=1 Tax=Methylobacterium jeotgali TaxID=381630 RepID=A0ABQ4T1C8_9HYPH|nr:MULTISPECIES: hypothetical protein [Methylobacterium]PIU05659.1 MAG: hypothetical protein COT56_13525 [Methylobacterium sp. CG09_land_8_20_14_0_10_71_15]PIU12369.1 MAG: hypothetical protein COT28_15370 [Methylobacterium sp. CG08_land_8_20_14_0_20_71_15]GBU16881.1 hypothetical protein AwMethylo_10960 [Methylobacterium sp.]GJE07973.1 hypothetical protein AOPFMNJM_3305 [Methylobacterium jeotgali]